MSGARFPDIHLLVAEDDALIALDIEQTMTARFGFRTSVVHTLDAAVACFDDDPPHLAVLDINLAGESTADLAARMAALGAPFVVVSGYRSHRIEQLAGGLALEKPFHVDDLADMISTALSRLS